VTSATAVRGELSIGLATAQLDDLLAAVLAAPA
jgi:hypothetical protein